MNRELVKSSNIRSVGYDPKAKLLELQFHSGSVYQYFEVPLATHTALMSSESKGKFFDANIRDVFKGNKI
jgi:hypothetical protein